MEELLGLDTTQSIVLLGSVVAGVELVKRILDKDWRATATIVVAAIIGGFVGSTGCGLSVFEGAIYGLSATGLFNFAQNLGVNIKAPKEITKKEES